MYMYMYMDEYPWDINHLTAVKLLDFLSQSIVYITHIKLSTLNPDTSTCISYVVHILFSQQECVLQSDIQVDLTYLSYPMSYPLVRKFFLSTICSLILCLWPFFSIITKYCTPVAQDLTHWWGSFSCRPQWGTVHCWSCRWCRCTGGAPEERAASGWRSQRSSSSSSAYKPAAAILYYTIYKQTKS